MSERVLPIVDPARTEFGFMRTVCGCQACTQHCRQLPGYLVPADLERIQQHLAPSIDLFVWAAEHLLASPGAKVLQAGRICRIPTLVPARQANGACRFLTGEGRCSIHAVAPFGCSFFDDHMVAAEANQRTRRGLEAVWQVWLEGGLYAVIWLALDLVGLRAPAVETVRQQHQPRQPMANTTNPSAHPAILPSIPSETTEGSLSGAVDSFRRTRVAEINAQPRARAELEAEYGQVWDTNELIREFEVEGFLAPYVVVRRRADGVVGSLEFQDQPRFFFAFHQDRR